MFAKHFQNIKKGELAALLFLYNMLAITFLTNRGSR